MGLVIAFIKKIVVLVLLTELVLQLQVGKGYQPYVKMLVGMMVVYSLLQGLSSFFLGAEKGMLEPMKVFQWDNAFEQGYVSEKVEQENREIPRIVVEEIESIPRIMIE